MKRHQPIAILYQAIQSPTIEGIVKPCKPGGYKDSGADIAFNLLQANRSIVTPHSGILHLHDLLIQLISVDEVREWDDLEWVFPDSKEGIEDCLKKGAKVIWANTVLFDEHPLHDVIKAQQLQVESQSDVSELGLDLRGVEFVGQHPKLVQKFDDKFDTNQMLKKENLHVANSLLVSTREKIEEMNSLGIYKEGVKILEELSEESLKENGIEFPLIIKPVRGRGSEGVEKVDNFESFVEKSIQLVNQTIQVNDKPVPKYGYYFIVEEFLNGDELTLTVMPPGNYIMYDIQEMEYSNHWALPPVKRFNHENGVAPYNGIVAVVNNSVVLKDYESNESIQKIVQACEKAAEIVQAKAPIRIDCRAHQTSNSTEFKMFDLNMKPNMTGTGRVDRDNQDSLSAIAARDLGHDFQFSNTFLQYYSTRLQWICYELGKRPEIQNKVREEIDSHLGKGINARPPNFDDYPIMNYVNAVIMESLRLHPPVISAMRYAKKTTTLGEFTIPKGTHVQINILAANRSKRNWEKPLEFIPERYPMNAEAQLRIQHDFSWIPFSMGNRKCIGFKFALIEAFTILVRILQFYELGLDNDESNPNDQITDAPGVTVRPGNCRTILKPRKDI